MSTTHPVSESFMYALSGLKTAFKNEPNLRIHSLIALIAIIVAAFLGFTKVEWIILAFTIAFVLILELVNTTLETLVDIVSPEIQEKARIAKDVSAASVFIAAALGVIIGAFLFLPKILTIIGF